ncbi:MAG: alpha-glucan family phosphorylase, partial [Actinobacteria bacterium]|nr:alpha-glucan family phosphorylase [Actinomycetota bacterium]
MPITDRDVTARVWRMDVGRVPVVLLDANVPENTPEDRDLTAKLYQGDSDVRIRQEILLGIGGLRALRALDFEETVAHMNEGHSAFLVLERVRAWRETLALARDTALALVRATTVFTTHTPVPAGHDEFSHEQIARHLGAYLGSAGFTPAELVDLGRVHPGRAEEPFGMTVLALRGSAWRNGVSALHGAVSRQMWHRLWPDVPPDEVPIAHVTNGVHLASWVSRELAELCERYIGPGWSVEADPDVLRAGIAAIPADEYWRAHVRRRERLITNVRRRLRLQAQRRWGAPDEIAEADAALRPDVLTVGFARRFAAYKRPTLLLRDLARLRTLLNHETRPVQLIFAGKAHPRDQHAKDLLSEITVLSQQDGFRGKLVFVEDYDMDFARDLVQGCDVWLNTPVRPQEASGTSGMKAAANGTLNLSVVDGWWAEGYSPDAGWAIGRVETDEPEQDRDASEAAAVYELLERSVAPLFYAVGRSDVPARWVEMSKAAMALVATRFSASRMVRDYVRSYYEPAHVLGERLRASGGRGAVALTTWVEQVAAAWP